MIRHLAPMPAVRSIAQLQASARSRFPSLIDSNIVDHEDGTPQYYLAIYFTKPGPGIEEINQWKASVAGHKPQSPTPEEQQIAAFTRKDQRLAKMLEVRSKAQAIVADPSNVLTDWTATERKLLLAVIVLDILSD